MSDSGVQMRSDIASVLAQMRAMRTAAEVPVQPDVKEASGLTAGRTGTDFGALLKASIDSVSELQNASSAEATAFTRGEHTDLVRVMVASQKSNIAFQALTQVRNRVVSAYQDIMNMPI
ncbi:MAG: flagellar hook-basal body complex protein FliE [Pseudomonadales bacterium]|nr:flagellar hook-basal body complex protein FliE [Pseudomonadales bacterium]